MQKYISILFLVTFLFASCDPGLRLSIMNETDSTAVAKFRFNEGKTQYFEGFLTPDSLLVELDSNAVQTYSFGIGTWEINYILDTLISCIDEIELTSWKSTQNFKGERQIRAFFESKVQGRYKERIEIVIQ